MLDTDRDGVGRQRACGRSDERSVGRVQILHPPPGAVGRQLGLAAADAGVGFTVDLRMDVPTLGGSANQDRLRTQRNDDRQPGGGHRVRALLGLVPGGIDPHLGYPVECPRGRAAAVASGRGSGDRAWLHLIGRELHPPAQEATSGRASFPW